MSAHAQNGSRLIEFVDSLAKAAAAADKAKDKVKHKAKDDGKTNDAYEAAYGNSEGIGKTISRILLHHAGALPGAAVGALAGAAGGSAAGGPVGMGLGGVGGFEAGFYGGGTAGNWVGDKLMGKEPEYGPGNFDFSQKLRRRPLYRLATPIAPLPTLLTSLGTTAYDQYKYMKSLKGQDKKRVPSDEKRV